MADFIKVAKLDEIPTDTGKLVDADGVSIALFKIGDEVFAIDSACPHQGGPMNEGGVHDGKAMCPWHGWEFDLKTGACSFNDAIKVGTYPVKLEGEDVFVQA